MILGRPVDHVDLRDEPQPLSWDAGAGFPTLQPLLEANMGVACATATNPAACLDALRQPFKGLGWVGNTGGQMTSAKRFLRTTYGDTVTTVSDITSYRGLFGSIDTEEEAALLADLQGYRFDCEATGPVFNAFVETGGTRLVMLHSNDWTCPYPLLERTIQVSSAGQITVLSEQPSKLQFGCAGRRPEGFASSSFDESSPLAAWLVEMATLEAASVPAFLRLARELERHGAPSALVSRARASACDEIRHHAVMLSHAERFGATPPAVEVPELPTRPLFEVALDNAVEGCVRETFAALVATFQASRAADPELAASLHEIAEDETRHAALSWDCAAWADAHLSDEERRTIACAKRAALNELRASLVGECDAELARVAGLPTRIEALTLFALVEPELATAA